MVRIHTLPWSQWEPLKMLSCAWRANRQGSRLTIATVQYQELIPCLPSLLGGLDAVLGMVRGGHHSFLPAPELGKSGEQNPGSR